MRLPDHMLYLAVSLGFLDAEGESQYAGSGFRLQLRHDEPFQTPVFTTYLVTVRHVVAGRPGEPGTGLKDQAKPFAQFLTLVGETKRVELDEARWLYPDDDSVDLALTYMPGHGWHQLVLGDEMLLTCERMESAGVGIGDETFSVSLFGFEGKAMASSPIVRVGNIAMLPREKVRSEFGDVEGYLVEARSLSGFSGAPVFVRESVTLPEHTLPSKETVKPQATGFIHLLGIMHAHWELGDKRHGLNTGIAIVVPAQKIADFLDSPAFREADARNLEHAREAQRQRFLEATLDAERREE